MMRIGRVKHFIAVLVFCMPFLLLSTVAFAESEIFVESEMTVDSDTYCFTLEFNEGIDVKQVTSSNTKAVTVEELYDDEVYGSCVYLYVEGPGKATITATDLDGNTDTCIVTVSPKLLVLDEEAIVFDNYDYDGYRYSENDEAVPVNSETNNLKTVTSSDTNVAKVTLTGKTQFEIVPVSAGDATITVKDIYNQTVTVTIEITKKYIDEMKYLGMLYEACSGTRMVYGDTQIDFITGESRNASALKKANIQVEVGGVKYSGKYKGYHEGTYQYTVKGIPIKAAGTKTKYTLSIGEASRVYSSTIKQKSLKDEDVDLVLGNDEKYSFTYTGKAIKPKAVVTVSFWDEEREQKLKLSRDYKIKYTNNRNVGTAKVTATGLSNYSGSISITFKILPKGTSLAKLKPANKAMTVSWKKQAKKMATSRITGYQIRYSLKKNMSGAKTVKVKGYAKTSKKITKLKAKKKYYVQIRTYKTIGKKTYYSTWSKKKVIKNK